MRYFKLQEFLPHLRKSAISVHLFIQRYKVQSLQAIEREPTALSLVVTLTAHVCYDRVNIKDSVRGLTPALMDQRGLFEGEELILIRVSKVTEKEENAQS